MEILTGKLLSEIEDLMLSLGEKKFRGRQIYEWIYVHLATDFHSMTNLSKELRIKLSEILKVSSLDIVRVNISSDGSKKYLFRLIDGNLVESVYIPEREWSTICISSQVGCGMGCKFCATAKMGFIRNLTSDEIVEQLLHIVRRENLKKKRVNVVFMGMGEPLLNLENVLKSYSLITDPEGISISRRRVTISTCGIIPSLLELKKVGKIPKLAISLNATTDEVRNQIMPINKRYPIKKLIDVCKKLPLNKGERITFEYVMLRGVNDSLEDAKRLSSLLSPNWAKINLIPYNPIGEEFFPSREERIFKFQEVLLNRGFVATIRDSKGKDISGACGMLASSFS